MPNLDPIPDDLIVSSTRGRGGDVQLSGRLSDSFQGWFFRCWNRWNAAPDVLDPQQEDDQTGNIAATAITLPYAGAGLYRFSWQLQVTIPASVSSSLVVTLAWTQGGVACSFAFPAHATNSAALPGSGTRLIRMDQNSAPTYAVAATVVGTAPTYDFELVAEVVKA